MTRFFRKSRGWRKLTRNRPAMAALVVITLYLLLALWVFASNTLAWIGDETGWFRIEPRSVAGMLLIESIEMRVGPKNLRGFGISADGGERLDQDRFMLNEVGKTLEQIDKLRENRRQRRADGEAGSEAVSGTPQDLLDDLRFAERRVREGSIEDIRTQHERTLSLQRQQQAIEHASQSLGKLRVLIEQNRDDLLEQAERLPEVERALLRARAAPPGERGADLAELEDRALLLREEIAFTLLDIADPVAEAASQLERTDLADSDAVAALHDLHETIADRAEEIEFGEPGEHGALPRAAFINRISERIETLPEELWRESVPLRHRLSESVDELFPMPTGMAGLMYRFRVMLGTDRQGRSILLRSLYSAKVAVQVGLVTALVAVAFGSLLGAAGAFFGGWMDHAVVWLYSTFSSVPYLVLLSIISFVFATSDLTIPLTDTKVASTLVPLYAAFALTFWIGPCRVIRGEAMKLKELEYVQAATAIGFGRTYIMGRHIIPNTSHLMFINFSLLFIGAIKGEVVLTFLGLGLKEGASWGIMISQARSEVLNGFFWQIGSATFFMFVLVLAFNILTDALQDAFDPKHVG